MTAGRLFLRSVLCCLPSLPAGLRTCLSNLLANLAAPSSPPLQVRNQQDRDAYEKAWKEAHAEGDEYQQKWGRAKVQRDGRDWGT